MAGMTAPASIEIGNLLESTAGVNGGRPCLAGSGLSVRAISVLYNEGLTPEQMLAAYPHVDLPRIYAAIAYYLANQERMDAELASEHQLSSRAKQQSETSQPGS